MDGKRTKYLLLGAGSLLVGASGAVAGTSAFKGNTVYVFLGYTIFVIAYKTCWYGVHQYSLDGLNSLLRTGISESKKFLGNKPLNLVLIISGLYLASYGTVEFAALVENPDPVTGLKTGLACFSGYIMAHEAVNEVPL